MVSWFRMEVWIFIGGIMGVGFGIGVYGVLIINKLILEVFG